MKSVRAEPVEALTFLRSRREEKALRQAQGERSFIVILVTADPQKLGFSLTFSTSFATIRLTIALAEIV